MEAPLRRVLQESRVLSIAWLLGALEVRDAALLQTGSCGISFAQQLIARHLPLLNTHRPTPDLHTQHAFGSLISHGCCHQAPAHVALSLIAALASPKHLNLCIKPSEHFTSVFLPQKKPRYEKGVNLLDLREGGVILSSY